MFFYVMSKLFYLESLCMICQNSRVAEGSSLLVKKIRLTRSPSGMCCHTFVMGIAPCLLVLNFLNLLTGI